MTLASLVMPVICSTKVTPRISKDGSSSKRRNAAEKQKLSSLNSAAGNIMEVVKKDVNFMKTGLSKGIKWANEAFRIPELSRAMDDFIWFRNFEDPKAAFIRAPSWPQPQYPELSGVDLFLADLKALEVYAGYFYCLSKMWTKPLPETYDPQEVADYFSLRPHVVALRLLEVFAAFVSASIRFQIAGIQSAKDKNGDKSISKYNFGNVLKETMLNLGPAFIKVGQSLSTRPDIIGSDVSRALSQLHDQIPPFPRAVAMKIIEEELHSPVEKLFSYVSEEPVAAASFGQVYRAATHDGLSVAVKVQRPNLRHVVVRDVYILRLGLGLLRKLAKRRSDLRLYADELGKGLVQELDYNLEARNASEFMEAHSHFQFIRVPKVFQCLSKKRVLTMEWMMGDSPSDLLFAPTEESRRKLLDLVSKGVEAALVQLLETGLLHADPHPGNLRYMSSGQIGFLDFGLLCRMERKHQIAMLASIVHIVYGDWASLVRDLVDMDVIWPGTNIRRVTMDLEVALGDVELNDGIPDVKFSRVLGKILSLAIKYQFRMPPYYTLVLRSLASLEGLAVAADPTFKTFEAAYPYVVQKLLIDNSAATRKILHSVVFNKRKEFQWQKLALFLRVGTTRNALHSLVPSNAQTSVNHYTNGVMSEINIANLVLRVLPSKNGAVLRRLLMTADGVSLVRAAVSKEASLFRQQFSKVLAAILYQWMCEVLGKRVEITQLSPQVPDVSATSNTQIGSSREFSLIENYQSILRDRRLRIIFFKALDSARNNPLLFLRFCWSSVVVFVTASALACHRMLIDLSEAYLGRLSYASKQIALNL